MLANLLNLRIGSKLMLAFVALIGTSDQHDHSRAHGGRAHAKIPANIVTLREVPQPT